MMDWAPLNQTAESYSKQQAEQFFFLFYICSLTRQGGEAKDIFDNHNGDNNNGRMQIIAC